MSLRLFAPATHHVTTDDSRSRTKPTSAMKVCMNRTVAPCPSMSTDMTETLLDITNAVFLYFIFASRLSNGRCRVWLNTFRHQAKVYAPGHQVHIPRAGWLFHVNFRTSDNWLSDLISTGFSALVSAAGSTHQVFQGFARSLYSRL